MSNEGYKSFIPGYTAYSFTLAKGVNGIKTATSVGANLLSGNYSQAGNIYGGFLGGMSLEIGVTAATAGIVRGVGSVNFFGLKGGYGLFGKNGFKVGNYKIEALYANPGAGKGYGTIFSINK